ncbi:hypothetical protein TIFTF001_045217 [Ficus carica]|uniref:Uncharacterized protein n=1 Tax=Ficus carica TaxID=3494 RepID=A0AA87Z0I2_FICCA|nr:hypothetical protein TIFTF001_045217 [Ficus carica]
MIDIRLPLWAVEDPYPMFFLIAGSNLQLRSELKQLNPEHSISGKYRSHLHYAMTCYAMFSRMPCLQECHVYKNAMFSRIPCLQKCHVFKNIMFSSQECHVFKNAMFSRMSCYGKG